MKKLFNGKVLAFIFALSLIPFASSVQSCKSKKGYNSRKGGKKVSSSGRIGNRKHKNRHVWGK